MTINRNLSFLAGGVSSTGVLGVPNGGSGATTLTGYLIGNGTSAFTASTTIPTSALSGTVSLTSQVSNILPIANGGTALSSFTAGQIHYGSFSQSANLFWDNTNTRLGVGTTSPSYTLDVTGTFRNTGIARLGTGATTTIANIGDDGTVGTKIIQFSRASAVSDVVNIQGINAGVGATYIALQALGGGVSIGNTTDPGSGNLSVTGQLFVGATSTVAFSYAGVKFNGAAYNGFGLNDSAAASGVGYIYFQSNGTTIGSIARVAATSAVVYNTTSDERLKTNIADASPVLDKLMDVKVRQYDWIDGDLHQDAGFIAQELEPILSGIVTKGKTEEDMWQLDYSRLTPYLVKAMQEQQTFIESLTQRIAILEAK